MENETLTQTDIIWNFIYDMFGLNIPNKKCFYDNDNIEYFGEWRYNMKNGEGKSYYKNGNIMYDGTWKNNMYNGYGVEYYENGNISYRGGWDYNRRTGNGVYYSEHGSKYDGDGSYEENIEFYDDEI